MNKMLRACLALLLVVLLPAGMVACQEPQVYEPDSAISLWEKIDQSMNSLKSMEITQTIRVIYYAMGHRFEVNGNRYQISAQDGHYLENTLVHHCEEMSLEQTVRTVDAYYDGKIYSAVSDGVYDQKLCSALSHEQYHVLQGDDITGGINIANCTVSDFKKEEAGWQLTFSGYTKKTIDEVLKSYSLTAQTLGTSIVDMEVSIHADQDFHVTDMKISFLFDPMAKKGVSPEFSVTTKYSALNGASFDVSRLKAEEYTLVDDVFVLENVAAALADKQNAVDGSFVLELNHTYDTAGNVATSKETDTVFYGRKNGAYYYHISSQTEDESLEIRYQSGEQSVTTGDRSHTTGQTEAEAKGFIDGLINSANYKSTAFTDIEKQEEGVYVLNCAALDLREYIQQLQGEDTVLDSGTQQITVRFRDGSLMQITGKTVLSGTYQNTPMTITLESNVTFGVTT